MGARHKINAKKTALCGVMTALALVLGYLEHLIPFTVGIYGIKLGLANLVTVMSMYLLGGMSAAVINLVRIVVSSLLFGNTVSLAYSLAGGLLSTLVMLAVKRILRIGTVGVSICGGITHNIAQLAVAIVLVSELKIAFYLPVLLSAGALTGFAIGIISLPIISNGQIKKLCKDHCE